MVPYYDYGVDYKWTRKLLWKWIYLQKLVMLWNYNHSGKIIILFNSQ